MQANECYYLLSWQTAFSTQKDFGKEAREAAWAAEQRTLHGLQSTETKVFPEKHTFRDINIMAEEARRRAEIARLVPLFLKICNIVPYYNNCIICYLYCWCNAACRLRELHTLKGKVESFAKLRGLDVDHVNPHYTVWVVFMLRPPASSFLICSGYSKLHQLFAWQARCLTDELKCRPFCELSIKAFQSKFICSAFVLRLAHYRDIISYLKLYFHLMKKNNSVSR